MQEGIGLLVLRSQCQELIIQAVTADIGVEIDLVAALHRSGDAESCAAGDEFPVREETLHLLNPVLVPADDHDLPAGKESLHVLIRRCLIISILCFQIMGEIAQGGELRLVSLPFIHMSAQADLTPPALLLQLPLLAYLTLEFLDLAGLLFKLSRKLRDGFILSGGILSAGGCAGLPLRGY